DSECKDQITHISTLNSIKTKEMKLIILKSITSAQELSFEEMRKHTRTYYLIEHEQQLPKLNAKKSNYINDDNTENKNHIKDDSKNWLKQLDETSPIDMLASWSESEPTTQQKYMVEELIEREQLLFDVIN